MKIQCVLSNSPIFCLITLIMSASSSSSWYPGQLKGANLAHNSKLPSLRVPNYSCLKNPCVCIFSFIAYPQLDKDVLQQNPLPLLACRVPLTAYWILAVCLVAKNLVCSSTFNSVTQMSISGSPKETNLFTPQKLSQQL